MSSNNRAELTGGAGDHSFWWRLQGSTKHRLMLITTSGGILAHLKQEQDHIIEANSADAIVTTEDRIIKLLLASITLVITIIIQYISDVMKVIQALVKHF
jgi:hypothetical protein